MLQENNKPLLQKKLWDMFGQGKGKCEAFMRKTEMAPRGEVKLLEIQSNVLKENMLGDPSHRKVAVYLPANFKQSEHYPMVMDLAAFTSSGLAHVGWKNFSENLPERLDRLMDEGKLEPAIFVFPDCFTRLGGNQYINSLAIGRYEDFLIEELIPFIEDQFPCGGSGYRGCFGHSSGGYGALIHGMKYPEVWSAVASHSGDMGFDLVYLSRMPGALDELAKHDHSIEGFIRHFEAQNRPRGSEIMCLMNLAMGATYDPDPKEYLGIRLPIDPETAEIIPERWENWRRHDPVELVEKYAENLKKLKGIFIDCGSQDEYSMHYGARRFHKALKKQEIDHIYEEHDGGHSGIDFRYDRSLPYLVKALSLS